MNALDAVLDRRTLLKAMGIAGGAAALFPVANALRGPAVLAQGDLDPRKQLQRLVAELDFDPQRIFRFVADEVGYDPYAGAMRGALGTLWSRAGSSADQALLLASLLAEAQVSYRFAVGRLDDASATGLLGAASIDVRQATERASTTLLSPEVKAAWSGQGAWKRAPEVDQLLVQARERADATVETLTAALAAAGIELPSPAVALPAVEREQHVWVQYASGPEWIDLDPSIPNAEAGTAYASVTSTPDELPDELFHTITIKAIAEVVQGGSPARTELLSQTLRVVDLVGTPITLTHPTAEWLGIGAALSGQQTYAPSLLAGDLVVEGSSITLASTGGVGGVFDDPDAIEGQAIAEWLSIDLAIPGGVERHAERTVFDRVSPQERAAGSFDVTAIAPVELVDLGEDIRSEYLPLSGFVTLAVTTAPIPWQYFDEDATSEADELILQSQVAHAFPYLRDLVRLETIGDRAAPRYVDDEPAVTAIWAAPTAAPVDGLAHLATTVDILHARHGSVPFPDADAAVPGGLLAGAMDHAAERIILEGTLSVVPDPPEQRSFISVGGVFELAAEQGIGMVVLRADDDAAATTAPALAANRFVADALASGLIVVGPASPVEIGGAMRIGWWEIDPATGLARDRLDDGFGPELGEYAIKLHHIATQAMCFAGIGMAIVSVVRGAINEAIGWAAGVAGMCIAGFGGGGH